jgi:hypothetical protein
MLKSSEQTGYYQSVHRAFLHVRCELKAIGLLRKNNIFDRTSYVYGVNDKNVMAWAIFVEGKDPTIMLPSRRLHQSKAFRLCLRDIFRHEFAHVIEHNFFGFLNGEFKDDFARAFEAPLTNKAAIGYTAWRKTLQYDKTYKAGKLVCKSAAERKAWYYKYLLNNYVANMPQLMPAKTSLRHLCYGSRQVETLLDKNTDRVSIKRCYVLNVPSAPYDISART